MSQSNVILSRQKVFSRLNSMSSLSERKSLLPETVADVIAEPSPPVPPEMTCASSSHSITSTSSSSHSSSRTRTTTSSSSSSSSSLEQKDAEQVIPPRAYALLATAVIALSSSGPSLDLQHDVSTPTMKIYWRMTAASVVLFPIMLRTVIKEGLPKLSKLQLCQFVCASFCYTVMCVGFVTSLEYTSVGNAVIFSNTNALLLLLGRFVVGSEISVPEGVGALVAFLGGVCCTLDGEAEGALPAVDEEGPPRWLGCWGDLLALFAAFGGTTYLVLSRSVRARFPNVYVYLWSIMCGASWFTLAFMYLSGQDFTVSRDISNGLFGFTHVFRFDRLPLELFMVFVTNMTGTVGYLQCTQYFDNLVISVAALTEPVVASSLAAFLGVGSLPGALGWIGNVLVAAGTVTVISPRPQYQKKDPCGDLITYTTTQKQVE